MNTTTNTTARRAATTVVLAGAAVLVAAPAFAGVSPEDTGGAATSPNKAQVEHEESAAAAGGLSPNNKTRFDRMDRAMRDPLPAPQPAGTTSDPSDPSSVPVTVLAVLGGTLIAGAAGFTVYRFRHHGTVGTATA